ncbi:sarcosine oxidase subunit gamma family protein [Streptomyces sp. NPDC051776]|uniref:sarcosine oxidase subunit gamma n=1 Tax=Streptomyces sp. NPDC051776 TaxID=3155414 RepID=UPI00342C7EA8
MNPTGTTTRRSPLDRHHARFAAATRASGGAVRLAEFPFLTQFSVRLDPKGPAGDTVGPALGVELPLEPNTLVRGGESAVLRMGPDEWLVVGPPGAGDDLRERLRAASECPAASVVDVSAQRTTLLVGGARSRDMLERGCSLDLHPRSFGAGRCASTILARTQVVLAARDAHKPGFWVLVRSSFAGYLGDWLLDAATEYTGPLAF